MIIGGGRAIVRFALILFDAAQDSVVDTVGSVSVVASAFPGCGGNFQRRDDAYSDLR
jgi:hypothetical protein